MRDTSELQRQQQQQQATTEGCEGLIHFLEALVALGQPLKHA
jgi:hypothetical protein